MPQEPILHTLLSVTDSAEEGVYLVKVGITDMDGLSYETDYVSKPGDGFGLAPAIRQEVTQWIDGGGQVAPYVPPSPAVPDRVTSRQFKMQLEIAGLTSAVEGWVASQSALVQIAYANSGTFVRDEPMMQAGFAALGFTPEQIDAFFTAAAQL